MVAVEKGKSGEKKKKKRIKIREEIYFAYAKRN